MKTKAKHKKKEKLWVGKCVFMCDRQSIYLSLYMALSLFYLWSTFFRSTTRQLSPWGAREEKCYEYGAHLIWLDTIFPRFAIVGRLMCHCVCRRAMIHGIFSAPRHYSRPLLVRSIICILHTFVLYLRLFCAASLMAFIILLHIHMGL